MVFHADFGGATGGGCNGVVDFFDTAPFVARALSGECCPLCEYETCFPGLSGASGGDEPTAAIVADALVNYTASARRDALIALMTAPGDADDAGAAQRVAFWTAVAAEIDARE